MEPTTTAAGGADPSNESADRPGPGSNPDAPASVQSSVAVTSNEVAGSHMRLVPLKSMKVVIGDKPLDAMVDSGAQIVLLNRSVLGDNASKIGEIRVQGVFGNADIVPVDAKRCDLNDCDVCMLSEPMQLFCGVVDNTASGYDMILPADIANELLNLPLFHIELSHDDNAVDDNLPADDFDPDSDNSVSEECVVNAECMNDESVNANATDASITDADVNDDMTNSNVLIDEQKNDVSFTSWLQSVKVILCIVTVCCIVAIVFSDNEFGS